MINILDKNIIGIAKGTIPFIKGYLGTELKFDFTNISGIEVPKGTTVITIDESISDPAKMISGPIGLNGNPKTNIVTWIKFNSHRFVGNYDATNGMIIRQLDDNSSELYADGGNASEDIKGTNGGDVFVKLPDFWFKGVTLDANKTEMHFRATNPEDSSWTKWDGNNLIGAYKGNVTNNILYSRSNVIPTVNIKQVDFKTYARTRSNGDDHFSLVTYEAHQVMALLYMCYYGNTNGQEVIGAGTVNYPKITGQTNVDGINDTVAENSRSINFWGLENWWGDIDEFIDNISTQAGWTGNGIADIMDYNNNLVRRVSGCSTNSYNIQKMILGEFLDMLPKSCIVSDTNFKTYYCDLGMVYSSPSFIASRSCYDNRANGGPFFLYVANGSTVAGAASGSRLQYHGRVSYYKPIEYKEVDMGDAGIWCAQNIGANSPEECGLYFAWGKTVDYTKDSTGVNTGGIGLSDEQDAANVLIGDEWHIPTEEEMVKLIALPRELVTINGVNCVKITAKNGNILYLPFVGYYYYSTLYEYNTYGMYTINKCTSMLNTDMPYYYRFQNESEGFPYMNHDTNNRYGHTIRAIKRKKTRS